MAMKPDEIATELNLHACKNREWWVQGATATSSDGDGLYEGLDWLSNKISSGGK